MAASGAGTAILAVFFFTAQLGHALGADRNACRQFAKQEWSRDEIYLWRELCDQAESGADSRDGKRRRLNIGKLFLKRLFITKDGAKFLPSGTLIVRNARFPDGLDMTNVTVVPSLTFEDSIVAGPADFSDSTFYGTLILLRGRFDSIRIKAGSLRSSLIVGNFEGSYQLPVPELAPSEIGSLDLSDSGAAKDIVIINGQINNAVVANNLTAGANISLGRVSSGRIELANASAGQQIDIVDSHITSPRDPEKRPSINLFSASARTIIISRTNISSQELDDDYLSIQGAVISGGLYISNTNICLINAQDIFIKSTFSITNSKDTQACKISLNLRDSTIQLLAIPLRYWSRMSNNLYGLKVEDLDPSMTESEKGYSQEEFSLVDWLSTSRPYSSEPYERIGKLLSSLGYEDLSRSVFYANRERQLAAAWENGDYAQYFALFGYWLFVGYGLRPQRVLIWVVLLVIIGSFVLRRTDLEFEDRKWGPIIASFDLLLPVISLNENKPNMPKPGWARHYVYAHKVMGYMLSTYALAALGLGK